MSCKQKNPTTNIPRFRICSGLFIMNCRFIIETNKMLKIWQIPTHLNGRKSSCAKVNLSLSTQQQRSYLRWNFTKLLLEWPGLKLGLTSYLPIERKEVFCSNRPRIYCETEAQTQTFTSDTLSLWQRHARCNEQIFFGKNFLFQPAEEVAVVPTPTRPTR